MSADTDAILRVFYEYCYATDSGDTGAWLATFTDDIVWEGGAFGRFEGREGGRSYHQAAGGTTKNFRHLTLNSLIDVQDAQATARSYVAVMDVSGAVPTFMFLGFYDDRLVKQDGRWRIKLRRLVADPPAP